MSEPYGSITSDHIGVAVLAITLTLEGAGGEATEGLMSLDRDDLERVAAVILALAGASFKALHVDDPSVLATVAAYVQAQFYNEETP